MTEKEDKELVDKLAKFELEELLDYLHTSSVDFLEELEKEEDRKQVMQRFRIHQVKHKE